MQYYAGTAGDRSIVAARLFSNAPLVGVGVVAPLGQRGSGNFPRPRTRPRSKPATAPIKQVLQDE